MKSNATTTRRTPSRRQAKVAPKSVPELGPPGTTPQAQADESEPDFDIGDIRPTVIIAPELRGRRDFVVVRDPDDTDAEYESRCNLLKLLLDYAEKE